MHANRHRSVLVGLALVATTWLASPVLVEAQSPSPEVVRLFEQGLEAYREGHYEEAAALFTQAHEIQPVPDLTYNRARALENLGDPGEAAAAYELYLEEMPDAPDRHGIEERIRRLRAQLVYDHVVVAEPPPPRSADAAPWIVLGTGAAAMIAGAITGAIAQSDDASARSTDISQTESDRLQSERDTLAITTEVLLAVGGAAMLAGLTWGVIDLVGVSDAQHARDAAAPSARLLILPTGVLLQADL